MRPAVVSGTAPLTLVTLVPATDPATDGLPPAGTARRQLGLVAIVQVLAMSVWFSTAAVVPSLEREWEISSAGAAWLTTAVQLGFVAGAVVSAALNLSDRVSVPRLIAACAVAAGAANLLVALVAGGLEAAVVLRFATGVALAGVYPAGVKLMASWFRTGRGAAMGALVGALTLGSAMPHLVNGLGGLPWEEVLVVTSLMAFAAGGAALRLREGPLLGAGAPLHPAYVREMFLDRSQRRVNLGYFGHMWELYAFWTWLPAYLLASLEAWDPRTDWRVGAGLAAFAVIGVAGAAGCVAGGLAARRVGSTRVAFLAMVVSAACCVLSGLVFGVGPWLLLPFLIVWGFAVIADSAQFSAALSDAADPRYVGTALAAQMAIGFIITVATIRLLPLLADQVGWRWSLTVLAAGPAFGAAAIRTVSSTRSARSA